MSWSKQYGKKVYSIYWKEKHVGTVMLQGGQWVATRVHKGQLVTASGEDYKIASKRLMGKIKRMAKKVA